MHLSVNFKSGPKSPLKRWELSLGTLLGNFPKGGDKKMKRLLPLLILLLVSCQKLDQEQRATAMENFRTHVSCYQLDEGICMCRYRSSLILVHCSAIQDFFTIEVLPRRSSVRF